MTHDRKTQGLSAAAWVGVAAVTLAFVFFVGGLRHTSASRFSGRAVTSVGLFSWYQVPAPEGSTYTQLRKRYRRRAIHGWRLSLTVLVALAGVAAAVPTGRELARMIRRNRPAGSTCPECGYDLHACPGRPCPECGWPRAAEAAEFGEFRLRSPARSSDI